MEFARLQMKEANLLPVKFQILEFELRHGRSVDCAWLLSRLGDFV